MGCGASRRVEPGERPILKQRVAGAKQVGLNVPHNGASSRPAHHVSKAAVSLAFLQRFIDENGLRELTTGQVVTDVIKPATVANQCRYTDLMLDDPLQQDCVSQGRPFFFISHVWSRRFSDTLEMVIRHFTPERQRVWRQADGMPLPPLAPNEIFLWLDMFAINQHQTQSGEASDLNALWEAVQDAEETLMVLDAKGKLLTRIWCLYEAWQSSRVSAGKLRLLSYDIPWKYLKKMFVDLSVSRAQASVQADRDRILEDIRRDVGTLDTMTLTLKDALVTGAVAQVPPEDTGWDHRISDYLYSAATLCHLYGRLQQAERLYRRDLAGCEAALGPDHPRTFNCLTNLAGLFESEGQYEEAEGLYRRALEGRQRVLGPDHADTLTAFINLTSLLKSQGRDDEAEPLRQQLLEACKRLLGPDHPSTITSVNSLANLLASQGKYDEAEPLYRKALESCNRILGPDHLDTLMYASNLGLLLASQCKYEEAELLCRRALEGRERVLGVDHLDTITAVNNLASLLDSQAKYDEAEKLYKRALEALDRVLGPDHADTLTVVNNLVSILECQGKYEEAEPLYRRAMGGLEQVLGPEPPPPESFSMVGNLNSIISPRGSKSGRFGPAGSRSARVKSVRFSNVNAVISTRSKSGRFGVVSNLNSVLKSAGSKSSKIG